MRNCKKCSNKFTPNTGKQIFCSKKCMNKFHCSKRNKEFQNKECGRCSKPIEVKHFKHIYCSEKCRKNKLEQSKMCIMCDNVFLTSYSKKIYCSDNCRENNIEKRISRNLRNRIWYAVNKYKAGSAVKDLGCSAEELRIYLESKFDDNMNWNNYGEWHIDHIKPLVGFNLTNRDEFKKACHYTNLQPLWAEDNLIKGGKDA